MPARHSWLGSREPALTLIRIFQEDGREGLSFLQQEPDSCSPVKNQTLPAEQTEANAATGSTCNICSIQTATYLSRLIFNFFLQIVPSFMFSFIKLTYGNIILQFKIKPCLV